MAYDGVPDLDKIPIQETDITPATLYSPYAPSWWMNSVISGIPEASVGWLVAQGWQVVGTTETDGVTYYNLTRQSIQQWKVLQQLLNTYVSQFNEGRASNHARYDDLLYNYNSITQTTNGTLNEIGDVSDAHLGIYISQVSSLLSEFESDTDTIIDGVDDDVDAIEAQLAKYLTKLNTIEGDFTTHRSTTRALLTDLGTTERARINEQYDNLLTSAYQGLVDRGLYSSTVYASYQTRIERERNEALSSLNDRLNREKLQNEHSLYGQLVSMKQALMNGRIQYNEATMRKSGFLVDTKHRLIMAIMQGKMQLANSRLEVRDREEKLMAYQLDTRNNLVIGMYGVIERRTDSYPSMESLTKLVAGLGDSGGGWIQP